MLVLAFSCEASLLYEVSGVLKGILQQKHKGKNGVIICLHMQSEIPMAILKKFLISGHFFQVLFPCVLLSIPPPTQLWFIK